MDPFYITSIAILGLCLHAAHRQIVMLWAHVQMLQGHQDRWLEQHGKRIGQLEDRGGYNPARDLSRQQLN